MRLLGWVRQHLSYDILLMVFTIYPKSDPMDSLELIPSYEDGELTGFIFAVENGATTLDIDDVEQLLKVIQLLREGQL